MSCNRQKVFRIFLLGLLFFISTSAFNEVDIQELPRDENEARILLGEGALDSALWLKIEPFYITPVCVPRGELSLLQELFFSLPDGLPSTPSALARYLPWDDAAQERLFAKYPELLPLKPILSFEYNGEKPGTGKTAFCFSRPGCSDTMRNFALFSVRDKSSAVQAEGRVDFTREYGRWYRRNVTVVPYSGYALSFGNFGGGCGDRLFSGFFPAAGAIDSSAAGNWLYGNSRSWNGVQLTTVGTRRKKNSGGVAAKAFVHAGPTERMGHGDATTEIIGRVLLQTGFSYLQTIDSNKAGSETGYFHYGLVFDPAKNSRFELQSGMDLHRPEQVPFDVLWTHHGETSRMHASVAGLPDGFCAPRSALGHYVTGKTGMGDTIIGYVTAIDLQYTHLRGTGFAWTPRISSIFADDALRSLEAEIGVSGRLSFVRMYRARYAWSPRFATEGRTMFYRQGIFECSVPLGRSFSFAHTSHLTSRSNGYWRYSGTITPQLEFGRVARLAPLFALSSSSTRSLETSAGIRQTLQFSEQTWSEIKIEKQFPESAGENFSAQGRMSFLF